MINMNNNLTINNIKALIKYDQELDYNIEYNNKILEG